MSERWKRCGVRGDLMSFGFGLQGSRVVGFRVYGSGLRVQGSGLGRGLLDELDALSAYGDAHLFKVCIWAFGEGLDIHALLREFLDYLRV